MTDPATKPANRPVQQRLCGAWAIAVIAAVIWLIVILSRGYHFDTSIMALLPDSYSSTGARLAEDRLLASADKRLILLIAGSDNAGNDKAGNDKAGNDKNLTRDAVTKLAVRLRQSDLFSTVQGDSASAGSQQWQNFYFPVRYQLLDAETRARLDSDDTTLIDESLGRLYSPLGSMLGAQLVDDPLQLFFRWQMSSLPRSPFSLEDGWMTRTMDGQHYRLLLLTLKGNPFDGDYQSQVMALLNTAQSTLPPSLQLLKSGLLVHAAFGASQARREISTIGVGSVLGILLLLLLSFRRASAVALAFLPLIVGCVCAIAVSMAVFERIHLLTLAFGASLIGVAIDYALHYLCASRCASAEETASHSSKPVLQRLLPSLTLGLCSSVFAYLALAATPFPGLRQMAVFSAVGLVAAWLTVVCWFPLLVAQRTTPAASTVALWPRLLAVWPRVTSRVSITAISLLAMALFVWVSTIEGNDDVRLLQTSPQALLTEDNRVRELLGIKASGQFFVVQAETQQLLLQNEEVLVAHLDAAVKETQLDGYSAVSQLLPSIARQQQDRALLAKAVYAEQGLLDQLAARANLQSIVPSARQQFSDDTFSPIQVDDWIQQPVSEASRHLWLGQHNGHYYSVVTVHGGQAAAMQKIADDLQLDYVDRGAQISALLRHYRQQLNIWLLVAYGAIAILLLLRYRRAAWRVMAAPALASLLTVSLLSVSGTPITLFHTLALLLVLGIGLDASIFMQDNGSSATWRAVTLSILTTLLAFGLLAVSATPVLHYFGITVLTGLVCVWLLVPCFTSRDLTVELYPSFVTKCSLREKEQ